MLTAGNIINMLSLSKLALIYAMPITVSSSDYNFLGYLFNAQTGRQQFNGSLSGTTRVSHYQKGKTSPDLLEQEIVCGSGISWPHANLYLATDI